MRTRSRQARRLAKNQNRQRRRKLLVEALEDRRMLAITTTFAAGVLTFTGDGDDDRVVLEATATPSEVNYDDGVGLGSTNQTGVTQVIFNGNGGDDQLVISHASGNLFAPVNGITFNGGADSDEVILGEGGAGFVGVYTPSGIDSGNLSYTSGGNTQSLDMTGVELLQDATIAGSLTADIGGISSDIDIIDGPLLTPVNAITQGPVIMDGGDRDDHGFFSGGNQAGWKFIEQSLDFLDQEAFNPGPFVSDILVIGATGGDASAALNSAAGVLGLSRTFLTTPAQIAAVDFDDYRIIYVPTNTPQTTGGISQVNKDALAARKADVQAFIRSGGGLMAQTEDFLTDPYSFVELPDPFTVGTYFTTTLAQTPALTAAGFAITDTELSNGTPSHQEFLGPVGFNGLDVWVVDPGGDGQVSSVHGGPGAANDDRIVTLGQGAINTSVGGGQGMEINDSGTGSFLTLLSANKTTVNVTNNPSGSDDILIDLTTAAKADGLTALNVSSSAGGDSYDVLATPSGVVTTLNGSSGSDDVTIQLGELDGQVDLNVGGGVADSLQINGTTGVDTIVVTPTQTTHAGGADINYDAALEAISVFGDDGNDVFTVTPSNTASIFIDGGDPTVFPGDVLNMDFTGLSATPPTLRTGAPRAGIFEFPGTEIDVEYTDIEDVNAAGDYHLIFDTRLAGSFGNNAVGDEVIIDVLGPDLRIRRTGVGAPIEEFFRGELARILSLTYEGSGDDDIITIDQATGGLPDFGGTVPVAPNNPNLPGAPDMLFNGRLGNDALNYNFGGGTYDQTYALGDGFGGGFGADVGTAQGEILTSGNGTSLQLYFTGLEPITTTGVPGGTLTVTGDLENNLIQVVDADAAGVGGPAGFTRVQAWNENRDFEPYEFSPYEFLDFAANAFTSLVIEGLGGDDILDFISFDAGETGAGLVTGGVDLHGDAGNDTISVDTNFNGTVQLPIDVFGGDGNDEIVIADFGAGSRVGAQTERAPTHAVDDILGVPVLVLGGPGLDSLRVDDSSQSSGFRYEFTAGGALPLAIGRSGTPATEYDPSTEDVTLETGTGSDAFAIIAIIPPGPPASPPIGVTHLVDDGGPGDTIDFSGFGGGPVNWDMDTAAVQRLSGVLPGGPLLQAMGTIENFVGSPFEDVVHVDPLGVPRTLLGGDPEPGDTFFYDPLGETVTATTGLLSFTGGLSPITHSEFTDANAVGATPVLVVDNSDAGFVGPGFAPISSQVSPVGPDIVGNSPSVDINNNAGSGIDVGDGTVDVATWTVTDIPNGWYAIAATWTAAPGQATNATYVIHDGTTAGDPIIGGSTVNQETDPGDFNVGGTEWRPIDYVQVTSNSLTVSLSDEFIIDRPGVADTLVADAVRIELLPPSFLVDDGDPFPAATTDPATFSATGGTSFGPTALGRFNDYHQIAGGSGDVATWTSQPGLPPGTYLVSTTWGQPNTFDFAAPFSINGGIPVLVNQDHSPSSFTLAGVPWESLAVVTLTGGPGIGGDTIEVTLTDAGGTRPVSADGILIQPIGDVVISTPTGPLSDGGTFDFGSTLIGEVQYETFTVTNTGLAPLLLSDLEVEGTLMNSLAIEGGFADVSGFSDTTVPAGGSATFTVRFGSDIQALNPGNPNHPTDPFLQGPHQGVLSFATNTFDPTFSASLVGEVGQPSAVILDNANHNLGALYQDPNGGTYARDGFTRFNGQQGYLNDVAFSAAGAGNEATWDFTGVGLPDGLYQVSATWSIHANRATNAPYSVNGSPPILINQQVLPDDFVSDGGAWEILTTVTVTGGTLVVTLSDTGADGFVIADAIRVQEVSLQVVDQLDESAVVDDGDGEFTIVGGTPFTYNGANNAFQNDLFFFAGDANGDFAEWDFHVDPGFYIVGVSWQQHPNRATDAIYDVSTPSGTNDTTAMLNQTLSPQSNQAGAGAGTVILDGKTFQILTAIEVPALDKGISINLSDTTGGSGGFLIADAAFVMRVDDPVLPLTLAAGDAVQGTGELLTQAQLDMAVEQAVDAWRATGLSEGQERALERLDVRLAPIGGARLGVASTTTGRVFIDRDGSGVGYGQGAVDVLSVVTHEIGHILGHADDDHDPLGVMGSSLSPGEVFIRADSSLALPIASDAIFGRVDRLTHLLPASPFDSRLVDRDLFEGRDELSDKSAEREVELSTTGDDATVRTADALVLSLLLDDTRDRRLVDVDAVFEELEEANEDGDLDDELE